MPDDTKTKAVEDVLDSWWSDFLLTVGPSLDRNAHAQVVTMRENLRSRILAAV